MYLLSSMTWSSGYVFKFRPSGLCAGEITQIALLSQTNCYLGQALQVEFNHELSLMVMVSKNFVPDDGIFK
jgi:hypothetical protein